MTSRNNEVRIDIEVEGGAQAERSFNRAEKGARGLGRSTRGLVNPLIGAGLVAGILGGGLLGLALSSGSASNSIFRIQGALDGLTSTLVRKLEPGIDRAANLFEKLPIAGQLASLALAAILGIGLVAAIGAAAKVAGGAISGYVGTAIALPLKVAAVKALTAAGAAITTAVGPLVAGLTIGVAAAIAAVVVGLASLALIAWDLIFNDGALLKRFDEWLSGQGWIQAITNWDQSVLQPFFSQAWTAVLDGMEAQFVEPFIILWTAITTWWGQTIAPFFTESVPGFFADAWEKVTGVTGALRDFFAGTWSTIRSGTVTALNGIVSSLNSFIAFVGRLKIPTVSVGFRSVSLPGGLGSVSIPTFSVAFRPLSSFGGFGARIPSIGGNDRSPRDYARQPTHPGTGGQPYPGRTVNNYYSLSATDFARAVNAIVAAPAAQARAVGLP